LTGDTVVYLPETGGYETMSELTGRSGFDVLALDPKSWKLERRCVEKAFSTGIKPVYRLMTALGRSIRATANHKFLAIQGWKRLDELSAGECLAVPLCLPPHEMERGRGGDIQWPGNGRVGSVLWPAFGPTLPSPQSGEGEKSPQSGEGENRAVITLEPPLVGQGDVYWDKIVSIEADGEEETFDLTVEGLHNFVAGDMVVHNSIEQDADVVIFLYREGYYNKADTTGIAEVIVAKNRNGPTGTVNLRFRPELTRFENLDMRRRGPDDVAGPSGPDG
jgi:replicative DNA helicase